MELHAAPVRVGLPYWMRFGGSMRSAPAGSPYRAYSSNTPT